MSDELKACPFCGETVSLDYSELPNKKHWYITCDCCGMMYQAVVCQRKDTKTGWNNRPIEDALNARIAELEAERRWIPVSEPPTVCRDKYGEFIPYLVCTHRGEYPFRAFWDGTMWGDGVRQVFVTHWMPLPELPEVK